MSGQCRVEARFVAESRKYSIYFERFGWSLGDQNFELPPGSRGPKTTAWTMLFGASKSTQPRKYRPRRANVSVYETMKSRLKWDTLLAEKRLRELLGGSKSTKVAGESRSEYERDRDRTVYSSPVRRLIRKTQVFPLDPSDFIRTRLMHSVEVSTVAEGLTTQAVRDVIKNREKLSQEQLEAISKVAETCGLLHDLGNPPFGHAGELAIASWFECTENGRKTIADLGGAKRQKAQDFLKFEGNAQTLRIVTNTHLLSHSYGLNLTCAAISAVRKYVAPSHKADKDSKWHEMKKPGYFVSEEKLLEKVSKLTGTEGCRHPITFLVEAADDIVYSVVDLEDSVKKGLLRSGDLIEELMQRCGGSSVLKETLERTDKQMENAPKTLEPSEYPQAFRVNAISAMVRAVVEVFDRHYDEIMNGSYHDELIYDKDCRASSFVNACKELLRDRVFCNDEVLRLELRGRQVIHDLMKLFWEGAETYLNDRKTHTKTYGGKLYLLISGNYRELFEQRLKAGEDQVYCAVQLVTDYIAGMTDGFACKLHQDLMNG
jgi:dGTPase